MIYDSIRNYYKNNGLSTYVEAAKGFSRWTVFLIIILVAFSLFIYIDNVKNINSKLAEIERLDKELEDVRTRNKMLMARIADLERPERINKIASETLGMTLPDEAPRRVLIIKN
ncbi:MAG: hypothetical protein Kapaf2KO_16930 [Candidatus Kapaibacteriales bacterium]